MAQIEDYTMDQNLGKLPMETPWQKCTVTDRYFSPKTQARYPTSTLKGKPFIADACPQTGLSLEGYIIEHLVKPKYENTLTEEDEKRASAVICEAIGRANAERFNLRRRTNSETALPVIDFQELYRDCEALYLKRKEEFERLHSDDSVSVPQSNKPTGGIFHYKNGFFILPPKETTRK